MKIKNNLIAITMIVMLLLSGFAIAPAVNSTTKSNNLSKLTMPYVERSMSWYSPIYGNNVITEGFEDGVMPPPDGWYTNDGNTVQPWSIVNATIYPDFVHSGEYAAWINYDSNNLSDNWLVTSDINLSGYVAVTLKFWAGSDTEYPGATMELHILGDGFDNMIWDMIEDETWETFGYRELTFNLSSYIGQTINISWHYVGLDGESFGLDDISVTTEVPNQPPVANYTYKLNDLDVIFTSTSSDPDGNIANWTWNFDDGTPLIFNPNPQHTYVDERIYNVTLTVEDNDGAPNNITKKINVANNPPVARFTPTVNGINVRFDASSSSDLNGTIVKYFWEFGDGTNGPGKIIGHTYEKEYMTYKVNLTVTDRVGAINTTSQYITTGDTTKPTIKIDKPMKALYIKDKFVRRLFIRPTLIIGDITIMVNASDSGSGLKYVQLWVGKNLKENKTTGMFNYTWKKDRLRLIHLFQIKVVAYDKEGNQAESKMIVRKIL
jgi:PKD repeat protein